MTMEIISHLVLKYFTVKLLVIVIIINDFSESEFSVHSNYYSTQITLLQSYQYFFRRLLRSKRK